MSREKEGVIWEPGRQKDGKLKIDISYMVYAGEIGGTLGKFSPFGRKTAGEDDLLFSTDCFGEMTFDKQ